MMQEGAGVRQVIEDELRERGVRLRDLDVRLELGLQESVRSAVSAGYGVTFISRVGDRGRRSPPARSRSRASTGSTRPARSRSSARPAARDARRAGVRRLRAEPTRVIVRWGLVSLLRGGARRARDRGRSSSRARAGTRSSCPSSRGALDARCRPTGSARPRRPRATASSRSAAAARSTSARRSPRRPGFRSSRSRRRTPAPSGRRSSASATRSGGCAAAAPARSSAGDRLRRRTSPSPSARGDGRDGAERARALRGGAVRARPQRGVGRARARGRTAHLANGCRASSSRPHDLDARTELLRGACARRARRSPARCSRSGTRSRRRSAGGTACRTAR